MNLRIAHSRILLGFLFMGLFALALPLLAHAQTGDTDLSATIRAQLLSDPRTSSITPEQLDAMVQLLTEEAQKQGVTVEDIYREPIVPTANFATAENSTQELGTCEGIPTWSCAFSSAFGFIGPNPIIAFTLGATSMALIWIIAEMMHRRERQMSAPPPASSSASAPPPSPPVSGRIIE